MSIRALYHKIPKSKRICSYYRCQKELQRNPDFKNGYLYHHGCKMDAEDERYRCLECGSLFDATEAAFAEHQIVQGDEVRQSTQPICPNCGCQNLKSLKPFGGS